jgi:hypothetical protein
MSTTYKDNLHILANQIYKQNKNNISFRTIGLCKNEAQRQISKQRKNKQLAQEIANS